MKMKGFRTILFQINEFFKIYIDAGIFILQSHLILFFNSTGVRKFEFYIAIHPLEKP